MRETTRERLTELLNKEFGRLTVKELVEVPDRNSTKVKLKCECQCGKITYPTAQKLLSGDTLSCGCLRKEKMRKAFFARKGNKKISEMTIWDWK